jgi:hypothetical protein
MTLISLSTVVIASETAAAIPPCAALSRMTFANPSPVRIGKRMIETLILAGGYWMQNIDRWAGVIDFNDGLTVIVYPIEWRISLTLYLSAGSLLP